MSLDLIKNFSQNIFAGKMSGLIIKDSQLTIQVVLWLCIASACENTADVSLKFSLGR